MAPKAKPKSRSPSPRTRSKAKQSPRGSQNADALQKQAALAEKLNEALETLFKCTDTDQDGLVERVEMLDAMEKEYTILGNTCGIQEKRSAVEWFKEIATGSATEGMYATKEAFLEAKKNALARMSGEDPNGEAHVSWVCDLAMKFHNMLNPEAEALIEPEYPIKIGIKALDSALKTALQFGKVPLVCCNRGDAPKQFFTYSSWSGKIIDAKQIVAEVYAHKTKTVEDVHEELRTKLLGAMETDTGMGTTLQIHMGNSACDFKTKFCQPGKFPDQIFGGASVWNQDECSKHFPDPMVFIKEGFNVIVVTDFAIEEAMEHLPRALPHIETMAIIEVELVQ